MAASTWWKGAQLPLFGPRVRTASSRTDGRDGRRAVERIVDVGRIVGVDAFVGVAVLACLAALSSPDVSFANWSCDDPLASHTVNELPEGYFVFADWTGNVVPDGSGGFYTTWEENANASVARCRLQRVDATGNRLWGTEGLVLFDMDDQHTPHVVADPSGSGVYAFTASSPTPEANFEVRLQRFGPNGERLWGPFGRVVFQACGTPSYRPAMVSDGADGFFLSVVTSSLPNEVRIQHVSADGDLLWAGGSPCGITAVTSLDSIFNHGVLADGQGGLFLSYDEFAGNNTGGLNVRAERLDANGDPVWGTGNGIMVCNRQLDQFANAPLPDGEGGVLIFWYSRHSPDFFDYVGGQRLDGDGNALWAPNGEQVLPLSNYLSGVMADGEGGAWISVWQWGDERDNYLQRVTKDAVPVYPDMIPISLAPARQYGAGLAPDGAGGCFLVWTDWRNGGTMEQDIYFQHVDAAGQILEQVDGAPVTMEPELQGADWALTTDENGGVFVVWDNNSPFDGIFAERLPCTEPADAPSVIVDASPALRIAPNPFPPSEGIARIDLSGVVSAESAIERIEIFDIGGRRLQTLRSSGEPDTRSSFLWDGTDHEGRAVPSGVYKVSAVSPSRTFSGSIIVTR
ncbi:MAG: FlgD immunoglobulin-like domain containing protein [Candidatus Eisenbacteria bacterium]